MNILGYNNDWCYNGRFSVPESIVKLKGSFIQHNWRGSQGHSIEFLMGQHTLENEEVTCPNTRNLQLDSRHLRRTRPSRQQRQ
jgi:hypothetical protein